MVQVENHTAIKVAFHRIIWKLMAGSKFSSNHPHTLSMMETNHILDWLAIDCREMISGTDCHGVSRPRLPHIGGWATGDLGTHRSRDFNTGALPEDQAGLVAITSSAQRSSGKCDVAARADVKLYVQQKHCDLDEIDFTAGIHVS